MTPQEALRLLDTLIADMYLTRAQHIQAQQALVLLEEETKRAATLDALVSAQAVTTEEDHGAA